MACSSYDFNGDAGEAGEDGEDFTPRSVAKARQPGAPVAMPSDDGKFHFTFGKSWLAREWRGPRGNVSPTGWKPSAGYHVRSEATVTGIWRLAYKPRELSDKKASDWICQGTFATDRERRVSNVRQNSLMIFDVDGRQPLAETADLIKKADVAAVLYTSWSHQQEKGADGPQDRFRVVLPLAQRFDFSAYGDHATAVRLWRRVYHSVGTALGLAFDPACGDAARLFYLGSRAPGSPVVQPELYRPGIETGKMRCLDLAPYIAAELETVRREAAEKAAKREKSANTPAPDLALIRSALQAISPDLDYPEWRNIIFAVHAAFAETNADAAVAMLDVWSQDGHAYTDGCVEKVWSTATGTGIGIRTLFYMAELSGWHRETAQTEMDAHRRTEFLALLNRHSTQRIPT